MGVVNDNSKSLISQHTRSTSQLGELVPFRAFHCIDEDEGTLQKEESMKPQHVVRLARGRCIVRCGSPRCGLYERYRSEWSSERCPQKQSRHILWSLQQARPTCQPLSGQPLACIGGDPSFACSCAAMRQRACDNLKVGAQSPTRTTNPVRVQLPHARMA